MDPSVANRQSYTAGYQQSWGHIPWDQLAPRGKALRRNLMPGFPWDEAGVPPMRLPDPWEPYREGEQWE